MKQAFFLMFNFLILHDLQIFQSNFNKIIFRQQIFNLLRSFLNDFYNHKQYKEIIL